MVTFDEKKPVVYIYVTDWCKTCESILKSLDVYIQRFTNFKFVIINVDEDSLLFKNQKLQGVPSFQIWKNGNLVKTKVGPMTREEFLNFLNKE